MGQPALVQPLEATEPGATVEAVTDPAAWKDLEAEWQHLFDASPTASPPLRFEWLWEWWRVYAPVCAARAAGLRLLTVRRGSRLIGALPLYLGRQDRKLLGVRRLRFLSSGEEEHEETCADYLDLLHLPGQETACLSALRSYLLAAEGPAWDELELSELATGSPLLRWREEFGAAGRVTLVPRGVCPIANLEGGFVRYLERLSAKPRQHARQFLRAAERAQAVLEVASDPASAAAIFGDLVRLHQQRWQAAGKPGCFAAERFRAFHQTLARLWVPSGKALLARLTLGGEAVAVIYGFVAGRKFDFYQSGMALDAAGPLRSPGTTALLLVMAHLAERGVTAFDFLRTAPSSYKHILATGECPLLRLKITRPTLRSRVAHLADGFGQGGRQAWRRLRRWRARQGTPPPQSAAPAANARTNDGPQGG